MVRKKTKWTLGPLPPKVSRFRLRIARSRIDRFGIFALASIPWRQKVIEYTGQPIGLGEVIARFKRIYARSGTKRTYLCRIKGDLFIDGSVGGSGAELINHSCNPNLSVRRTSGRVFYISRRKINAGEELTVDYRFARNSPKAECRCGWPDCRGTINRK